MHMSSGRWIDIKNPKPDDIDLQDIAQCLSGINRWGGCCKPRITDEDHCLFCERLIVHADARATPRLRLLALLHDAHEAYLGDMRRPVAIVLGIDMLMGVLKERIDLAIYAHLDIDPPTVKERRAVKIFDNWALQLEAQWYMPKEVFTGPHAVQRTYTAEDPPFRITQYAVLDPPGITWLRAVRNLREEMME